MFDYSTLQWLDSHINYETDKPSRRETMPTLERMKILCTYLGDPQDQVKAIHITGTNGKTSTTRISESLLRSKGLYTGMVVSPHLTDLNERICLDGIPVSEDQLMPILANIREVETHIDVIKNDLPSWFEIIVAASFCVMSEEAVDVGIIEVGMGGLYDATNVCDSDVSVFTNIDLDHTKFLGDTREKIAQEKSGIIKTGNRVVIGEADEEISQIFVNAARDNDARTMIIDQDFQMISNEQAVGGRLLSFRTPYAEYREIFLPLFGSHQGDNALIATVAAEAFIDAPLGEDVVTEGFGAVRSPGRMEVIHREPLVLVDGAHNVSGAQTFSRALDEEFARSRRIYILGLTGDKDATAMIDSLRIEDEDVIIATQSDSPRAMSSADIATAARAAGMETVIEAETTSDAIENALSLALDDDHIVVTGSLYVVGEARSAMVRQSN